MTLKEKLAVKEKDLLNIYCTAGYPGLNDLPKIIGALHRAGVDMVEIGIPYSDPLADGPTIQKSNAIALENGISLELIFEQLADCEKEIPKIMMGYFNSVYRFGFERFCQRCHEVGVSGVILPDLPVELYATNYQKLFEYYGLSKIFLITPQTPIERIKKIDTLSSSFIYAVSSSSTTGKTTGLDSASAYLENLKTLPVKHPILVGFNISKPEDLALVQQYANGGIIGSAFIKHLAETEDVQKTTAAFVKYITS